MKCGGSHVPFEGLMKTLTPLSVLTFSYLSFCLHPSLLGQSSLHVSVSAELFIRTPVIEFRATVIPRDLFLFWLYLQWSSLLRKITFTATQPPLIPLTAERPYERSLLPKHMLSDSNVFLSLQSPSSHPPPLALCAPGRTDLLSTSFSF